MQLQRRRVAFDENLPDGSTVDEALRSLNQSPDRMSGVASSPTRAVALPDASASLAAPVDADPYENAHNPAIPSLSSLKAPPTMIQKNNKGRPVAIVGGDDPISNNMELIRAQEGYKAPRSTKDQILSFLEGGVPGGIAYATDQDTRNRWAVGGDIAREQGQIQRRVALDKSQNDLLNDQARRQLEGAQAIKALQEPREPGFTLGEGQTRYDPQGNAVQSRPPKAQSKPPVKQADDQGNEYLADADTGEPLRDTRGGIRYTARAKAPKPDESPKLATRQRNYQAAKSEYDGLIEEEKSAAKAKDKAYADYSTARSKYGSTATADIQPDVIAAKVAADRAQAKYGEYWGKKDAAKAKMIQHGDGVDANGDALPPKVTPTRDPSPSTHVLNKKAWLQTHPESDWPKAVTAAKTAGYQIVE